MAFQKAALSTSLSPEKLSYFPMLSSDIVDRPLSSDICHEFFGGEFPKMLADHYSPGWIFESVKENTAPESEYSNPESEDFHHQSEGFTSFMSASNIRATGTKPQISQDSTYHSRAYSTMNPLNLEDRFGSVWDDGERGFAPILSRSQAESSNGPKMAKKSTPPSTSFRPQIPNPRSPDWESAYTNFYDLGKHQESRHATGKFTSNDRPTSSSSSRKPKPYFCIFPECEAAFARPYDLGRHQQSRHVNSKRFDCPVENCRRFGVPMTSNERGGFTRLDHFRDHVKNLHRKAVIKDKNSAGGQYWVTDHEMRDGKLWMRDETGSILVKDHNGRIQVKDAMTGRWHTRDR